MAREKEAVHTFENIKEHFCRLGSGNGVFKQKGKGIEGKLDVAFFKTKNVHIRVYSNSFHNKPRVETAQMAVSG